MNACNLFGGKGSLSAVLRFRLFCLGMVFFLALWGLEQGPAQASESTELQAKQVWQLLDYVAVDYGGAVADNAILKASEYQEMQEFTTKAERQLSALPQRPQKAGLQRQATALRQAVAQKADPATVARLAHRLATAVQQVYPFPVAPTTVPDLARGAQLFQAQCASCHGLQGGGDGPLAKSLEPKPIALSDPVRARKRSLLALHQVITNGVPETAMQSYQTLSDAERWDLAFFVGTLSYPKSEQAAGAKLWQTDTSARKILVSLGSLTQTSEQALAERLPASAAKALMAYLRAHPAALAENVSGSLSVAQAKLAQSVLAVQNGERATASRLALSAYLDGFEPIEPTLAMRNHGLFEKIETDMGAYRALVQQGSVSEVQAAQQKIKALLDEAEWTLAPAKTDAVATFVGALTILLREGLEALLVVVGMLAFLKKAERREMLAYVHIGWITALGCGGLTWLVATYLVSISGASRELIEGFSSLFATVVLLAVGVWMHQKSMAGRWQIYLQAKLSAALNRRTAWFLFSLAFIAVYREVFETILFYAALWTKGNGLPLLAGLGSGIVLLSGLTFILLRTSARLPIGQFFALSSVLVSVLAVVLAGKGMAGLQEAGLLPITLLPLPRIEFLGVYPSWQPLSAQICVLVAIVVAFVFNQRSARRLAMQEASLSSSSLEE